MDLSQAVPNHEDFLHTNQTTQDDRLLVKFFTKAREDKSATLAEGRPIFKDVEYIDIKIPGSRTGGACRPATQRDKERFPRHYAAFQQRQEMPDEGTPLAMWPPMSRALVEQMAFFNVKTVEQLAAVPDNQTKNMLGMSKYKQLAQAYLDASKADAPMAQMQAELAERDAKIKFQGDTIGALTARLDAMEAATKDPSEVPMAGVETVPTVAAAAPEPALDIQTGYTSVLDAAAEPEPESGKIEDEPAAKKPATRRRRKVKT